MNRIPKPTMTRNTLDTIFVRSAPHGGLHRGILRAGNLEIPCSLGRSGITPRKREGDGATPAGRFGIVGGFYRPDRTAALRCGLPLEPIAPYDGWCDAPEHAAYNRKIALPFNHSHERMWREDRLYDICLVLDFNLWPRKRFGGSAIFFHLTSPGKRPTEGCVAIEPDQMWKLLPKIGSATLIAIQHD